MQSSNTNDLIFGVPALVEWLSRFITFHPGDLVWTARPRASAQRARRRGSSGQATSSRPRSAASARCATR